MEVNIMEYYGSEYYGSEYYGSEYLWADDDEQIYTAVH